MNKTDFTVFEGMTSISAIINSIRNGFSDGTYDRKIVKILFDRSKVSSKRRELSFLKACSSEIGYELELCDSSYLDEISVGNTHGGILALCTDRNILTISDSIIKEDGFYALVEGVEDPYNFGYSIRSLYAAGVDGIILSPRNWMSASGIVAKASAGTSELLPMYSCDIDTVCDIFKKKGYRIIAAGIRDSVSYKEADLKKPLLFIVGGEKRGISRSLLDHCDLTVRIDYGRHFKGSLPTASAVSVIAFEILSKNSNY